MKTGGRTSVLEPASSATLFDAHLHPTSMSTQDLESMRFFGVTRALVFAPVGAEKTASKILESLRALVTRELPRLKASGIQGLAAVGIHPRSIPRRGLAEVMAALPDFFKGGKVVALGETGLHEGTEEEVESLQAHLALGKKLKVPVILHSPQKDKERQTRRMLTLVRESGILPSRVLVDHANPRTVKLILELGCYAGLTLHPDELSTERAVELVRKLGPERLVLDSDAGDRAGDILTLGRAFNLLQKAKLSHSVIARVTEDNVLEFLRR